MIASFFRKKIPISYIYDTIYMVIHMNETRKKYTVLLLSAPIGSGHRLAAEALEQALADRPEVEVIHGNIFDFFPQFLGKVFLGTYLWILKCCPWLYKLAYSWGNKQGGSLWMRELLNRLLAWLGGSYLRSVQPDAVIATHATPAGIIGYYKKQHPKIWLGAVVTDFTIHRWWVCDGVDTYFIADELLRDKLATDADIQATGIPVRQQFMIKHDKQKCREFFGWDETERVCLLMGGGEGLLPMAEIITALQRAALKNLRVVAVTGHNEALAAQLQAKYGATAEIYGFREDVPQLMAGADMIITKAGGLTSAEVLASGLDLLIYKPLPGQEEGNAAFLQQYCGALVARSTDELVQHIKNSTVSPREAAACSEHAHPLAAQQIVDYVMQRLQK